MIDLNNFIVAALYTMQLWVSRALSAKGNWNMPLFKGNMRRACFGVPVGSKKLKIRIWTAKYYF